MSKNGIIMGISKIFGKGKTQIPIAVRTYLQLKDNDKIYFTQDLEGKIIIEKVPQLVRGKY